MKEEHERLLNLLEEYFEKDGKQRLGQLVTNAAKSDDTYNHFHHGEVGRNACPFYLPDERAIKFLEEMIDRIEEEENGEPFRGIDAETVAEDYMSPKTTVQKLKELMHEVFESEEQAKRWLDTEAEFLDGRKPIELYREGKSEELITMLATAESGAYL